MPNQSQFHSTNASDKEFFIKGFDVTLRLETRDGDYVEILTTNGPGPAPVIGILFPSQKFQQSGAGKLHRWNYNGKSYDAMGNTPRSLDLVKNVQRQFNWGLPYRTRSGMNVTVLTNVRNGDRNIVALVGSRQVVLYYPDGRTRNDGQETALDLVNA